MTKEQARALINPRLLNENVIPLGDGDVVEIKITDDNIDSWAKIVVPILEREDQNKGA